MTMFLLVFFQKQQLSSFPYLADDGAYRDHVGVVLNRLDVSFSFVFSHHLYPALKQCMFSRLTYQQYILEPRHLPTLPSRIKLNSFSSRSMTEAKGPVMEHTRQQYQETEFEAECRRAGKFQDVEHNLGLRWSLSETSLIDKATSLLGLKNPFSNKATPDENIVWLLDNTAYRPEHPYPHDPQPWQAEFVACFFMKGRKELTKIVSNIADQIGLDGQAGNNEEVRKRIAERVEPLIHAIAPARTIQIRIPAPAGEGTVQTLGPSNSNGISSQVVLTGGSEKSNGTIVKVNPAEGVYETDFAAHTRYAGPDGWGIISDIDDTIKVTQTVDAIGILKTTFVDIPKTTPGMPEFYQGLDSNFQNPAWFYLSASPYNLYPFLHTFIHQNYKPGTLILRENSWMYFGGLLQSLTQGTQAYKTDRMRKIHSWLPKRKMICIGDSTQTDPESYAQIYREFPGWIHAIYIRKVTDAPNMEAKNKPERFEKAFEGVPGSVWKLFTMPSELADHVSHLAGTAHGEGISGS